MENKTSDNIYELYAFALAYPDESVRTKISQIQDLLDGSYPDASESAAEFFEFAKTTSLWKWEEIYTRTFDVQAISTLDVGYTLFGDDYKRGELLVNLSKEYNKTAINCGTELADHLPNILKLITRLNDDEIKNDLVCLIIKPALKKIIAEFASGSIDKKNSIYDKNHRTLIQEEKQYGRVYQSLLKSLSKVMDNDFPDDKKPGEDQFKSEFANEMEIPE